MKKSIILLIIAIFSIWGILNGQRRRPKNPLADMYENPYWQQRFVGDLAFVVEREPRISVEERDLLYQIRDLLPHRAGEAIEILDESLTTESSAAMTFVLGQLNLQIGNLQQAKLHMLEAAKKYPNYLRAHKALSIISVRLEEIDDAVKYLTKSIVLGDNEGRTYGLLGYCYQLQEKTLAAEQAYSVALIAEPGNLDWKNGLARSLLNQGKYKESRDLFEEMLRLNPNEPDNWVLLSISQAGLKEYDEAAANILILMRTGKAPAESLQLLAEIYLEKQMLEPALKAYLAAIDKNPKQKLDGPLQVAYSLTQEGSYDKASSLVNKIRRVYRGRTTDEEELTLMTLQSQIAIAQGEGIKAKATLEKIVERDPLRGPALITLGTYYGDNGEIERAILMFERAQEVDKFRAEALVAHARLMVANNKWSNATELLRDAQSADYKDFVQDLLEQVERIRRAAARSS